MRTHTGDQPFKCSHEGCGRTYVSRQGVLRHEKSHTDVKTLFECRHCKQLISTMDNLKRHIKRKHSDDPSKKGKLICQKCGKSFKRLYCYEEHLARHDNISLVYKCKVCNKSFLNYPKLRQHQNAHTKKSPCTVCKETFDTYKLRRGHEMEVHKEDLSCPLCKKFFYRKTYRENHIEKCQKNQSELMVCTYEGCTRAYRFKRNLYQHMRLKHENYTYFCHHCAKQLQSRVRMIQHLKNKHENPKERAPQPFGIHRKRRIDRGIPKKSMVTSLAGIEYDPRVDKALRLRVPCTD